MNIFIKFIIRERNEVKMKKFGNILWGLVFIAVGLIVGCNAMGITNINIFFKGWWTLFIIVPSFIGLFKDNNKTWDIIWLVIGIVLFLCIRDILSFAIIGKLIFPFILVMIGLSFIFKDTFRTKVNEKIKKLNAERVDGEDFCATFSGINSDFNGQEFKGANIDAIFGGVEIDLTNAIINHDQIINASAIFGGIDIRVPKGINIKVKSTPIFGGVSNKLKYEFNENIPTIYINAFCLFGGVDIK